MRTSEAVEWAREQARYQAATSKALAWHLAPPIRIARPGTRANGAFLHGLDSRSGEPLGVYTEITGYAISLLVFLARTTGDPGLLDSARESADYLIRIQSPEGAFPDLPDPSNPTSDARLFTFDTAICATGLARLYRAVGEDRYRESALAAGRWLLRMRAPDGSFLAQALENGSVQDPGGFYGDGSCIHAKVAMALLELHDVTAIPELRAAAVGVCDHTLRLQDPDGGFFSRPSRRYIFTHAHGYACEGLIHAGTLLAEGRYLESARRGIEWLARKQEPDGGWLSNYRTSFLSPRRRVETAVLRPEPSDATAQAARLFALAGPGFDLPRRAAIHFLLSCQAPGGGFFHRRTRLGSSRYLYTWCAQFAIQALTWTGHPSRAAELF
jgi:hypothetical protein